MEIEIYYTNYLEIRDCAFSALPLQDQLATLRETYPLDLAGFGIADVIEHIVYAKPNPTLAQALSTRANTHLPSAKSALSINATNGGTYILLGDVGDARSVLGLLLTLRTLRLLNSRGVLTRACHLLFAGRASQDTLANGLIATLWTNNPQSVHFVTAAVYLHSTTLRKCVCVYKTWQPLSGDARLVMEDSEFKELLEPHFGIRELSADVMSAEHYRFDTSVSASPVGEDRITIGADSICGVIRDPRVLFAVSGAHSPETPHIMHPRHNCTVRYLAEGLYVD
jgi:hypothetical protein